MQRIKLLTAICEKGVVHFDNDGRIYDFNPILHSFVGTNKFIHLDYYGVALYMRPPERVVVGGYDPILDEITFEDVTSNNNE